MSAYVSGGLLAPAGGTSIVPQHVRNEVDTTPGSGVAVLSFGTLSTTYLRYVYVTCSAVGVWRLLVDGSEVSKGRTAPGHPNSGVPFDVELVIDPLATIEVEFTARTGSPITQVFAQLVGRA